MAEQRLPKVNQDDGTWGDILRQYLKKEHIDDGTDNTANGGHQHITITASDGTAGTAPITLTSGTLLSAPAIGAIEFNNDTLYFTKTTGTTRMQVVMDTATQTLTNKTISGSGNTITNISLTTGVTGVLPVANGGTNNGFFTVAGPASTAKTYTFPNANATILTSNAAVTVAQGGTGRATSTTAYGLIAAGTGATTAQQTIAPGTAGQFLKSAGASALASFAAIQLSDLSDASSVVTLTGVQTLTNKTLTDPKIANTIKDANGNTILNLSGQTSAVNNWIMKNRASGAGPTLEVEGTDTDIWMNVVPKGNAGVTIYQNTSGQAAKISTDGTDSNININMIPKGTGRLQAGGVNVVTASSTDTLTSKTLTAPRIANNGYIADANGNEQIVFGQTTSAVNQIKVTNAATTTGPIIAADGGDTNIDLNINSKGTGQVKINGSTIPVDANLVHKAGTETVTGQKTFTAKTYTRDLEIQNNSGDTARLVFNNTDASQIWEIGGNVGGGYSVYNSTQANAPFYIESTAPDIALAVTSTANVFGQKLDMDGNTIANGVVDLHPESDGFSVFPHMVNDIAYNTRLGGSTLWKKNGVTTLPDYGDDNIFLPDATMASYAGLSNPTTDTITVEVTLYRAFNWGVKWGIVMTPWCCAQNVQLEVWDNTAGSWATAYTKTNDDSGMHWASYAASSGHDMTKIRWTLTNFNNPDPRITQIAAIQYNSSLLSGPFAPRSGGDIYGTYRFWPDVAGQSASIALDNRSNQSWLHATNSSGQLTIYDETNDKTPFLINRNTPTGALTLDTTEIHAQLPLNMHSQKITSVTNPTAAQDAATKSYVDSATATLHQADGNLVIGGDFQTDALWVNAWGTQTTEKALPTGGKSHKIISTGGGTSTDFISLSHNGTGTPSTIPGIAPRIFTWKIQLLKKNTNTGGGNIRFRTLCTGWDGSTASAISTIATADLSNTVFQYWDRTHTVSSAYKSIQFLIELDSGVPAGDTFYLGAALINDVTGAVAPTATQTLTNKRITARMTSIASNAVPTYDTDDTDLLDIYALSTNITSMTTNMTGTPTSGQKIMVRIKGDATPRTITWGSAFVASGITAPITTTVANKEHHILFIYSDNSNKWVCLAADAAGY